MRNNPKTAEEMYSDTRSSCMSYSDFLFLQNEDLSKQIERLQKQLNEANKVIKHYANDENWCDYYDDNDEKMIKAIYIDCNGDLEASCYLKKWGVK